MMLKGHGNDHNSNDPCILCKCASTRYIAPQCHNQFNESIYPITSNIAHFFRYTLSQPAQNDPRLSLYKRVGSFWNHLEMSTHLYTRMEDNRSVWRNLKCSRDVLYYIGFVQVILENSRDVRNLRGFQRVLWVLINRGLPLSQGTKHLREIQPCKAFQCNISSILPKVSKCCFLHVPSFRVVCITQHS